MADEDLPRPIKTGGGHHGYKQSQVSAGQKRSLPEESEALPEKKKASGFGFGLKSSSKPSSKISMNLGSKTSASKPKMTAAPIKMSLGSSQKPKEQQPTKKASLSVASAFNQDDDSDEEEMPPEAKMRMRNLGRETPTAAGPNSFGKNMLGFCDRQKIIQRELEKQMEEIGDKD